MPDTIAPASVERPASGVLAARIAGIVFSPRATFREVAARPRWLGVWLCVVLVTGAASTLFLTTDVGQRAMLDRQISQAEASGRHLTDLQVATLERMAPYFKYFGLAFQIVVFGLGGLIVAAIAMGVFTSVLGGDATFKQVFAVVAHSGVILAIQALFTLPLAYARETLANPTSVMVFLPMLDENTFIARAIGSIDLFRIWWTVTLAIGLGVLYRRRTGPIAAALLIVYATIAVLYAAGMTALAGA